MKIKYLRLNEEAILRIVKCKLNNGNLSHCFLIIYNNGESISLGSKVCNDNFYRFNNKYIVFGEIDKENNRGIFTNGFDVSKRINITNSNIDNYFNVLRMYNDTFDNKYKKKRLNLKKEIKR